MRNYVVFWLSAVGLLCATDAVAQLEFESQDVITISARVVEGLNTTTTTQAINTVTNSVPTVVTTQSNGTTGQANGGNQQANGSTQQTSGTNAITVSDLAEIRNAVQRMGTGQPGVVVSMAVINPDGTVVETLSGITVESLAEMGTLPNWVTDPETLIAGGRSMIRRDADGGYYLYINIAACDV